uniref:uridine diphosphate glucose pyrophosphatase NUDT22 n=1 Tax=Centroberyx gerrardi TaxID=166262 RepID=UPI003AAB95EF
MGEEANGNLQCEMDPEVSVLLHCAAWRGLLQSRVQVELSERFDRQTDAALERHIDEVWTERVSREPWLFNGAKFRLHSFSLASSKCPPSPAVSPRPPPCTLSPRGEEDLRNTDNCHRGNGDGVIQQTASPLVQAASTSGCSASDGVTANPPTDDPESSPLLSLRLGLTCYKDFLGTNWSCRAAELRRRGEAEFGDPLALLAQPLGVGGVLCTRDGQVVLIRRSQRVAEAGGLLDIPGGHPEPQAVCEEQISVAMLQQRQEAVVSELFSSVCAEIRDEVNVPLSFLGEPVLMGVALNHTSAGRPSAEFYISCSLTSDEVRELYWRGGAEAHESTDIVFLSRTDVLRLDRSSPLWSELCPSAKGAVLLYQLVMPDRQQDSSKRSDTQDNTPDRGSR